MPAWRPKKIASIVSLSLLHFHNERYLLPCYCVMPNHVHLLVKPMPPHEPAELLHSWKGFTAKEINRRLDRTGSVWEPESYDTLVRDAKHLWKVIRYIGKNPAKARLPSSQWIRHIDPLWQKSDWGFAEDSGG